jgi:hypothetical protein
MYLIFAVYPRQITTFSSITSINCSAVDLLVSVYEFSWMLLHVDQQQKIVYFIKGMEANIPFLSSA